MKRVKWLAAAIGIAAGVTFGSLVSFAAGGTYYTYTDNERNAGDGVADGDMATGSLATEPAPSVTYGASDVESPIEFNIFVATLPTSSASLTIRAYDVDEEPQANGDREQDDVFLNGQYLGKLTGANNVWSTTVFNLTGPQLALLTVGSNRVQVYPDTFTDPSLSSGGTGTAWVTAVRWGQILVDGGAADFASTGAVRITGCETRTATVAGCTVNAGLAANTVRINSEATVHAVTAGNYRLEVAIIDPLGNYTSVTVYNFAAAANSVVTQAIAPTYTLDGITGEYIVQSQLFYIDGSNFPVQQDIATATFQHTINVGPTDLDDDGLTNAQETTLGTNRLLPDTDGDGETDALEVGNVNAPTDSDGDGSIDALESSVLDADGDGLPNETDASDSDACIPDAMHAICLGTDSDGDGLTNAQEDSLGTSRNISDTDGDGVADAVEAGNPAAPTDTDGDGIIDALEPGSDTDADGTPDSADLDSDNDGVLDQVEVGNDPQSARDSDADGIADYRDRDSDNDGIPDAIEIGSTPAQPNDTDGDGIADYLDVDSDNDGVPDRIEGGVSGSDADGDGIDDAFDVDVRGGVDGNGDGIADGIGPVDSDRDGVADYRDVDSDNDGLWDTVEGDVTGNDADGDGIDDAVDVDLTGGADLDHDGIDDAYRPVDTDGDGVPDMRDLDSDNDSVMDVVEAALTDTDENGLLDTGAAQTTVAVDSDDDGTPDFRDNDSNNDGVTDIAAHGHAALDADGNGRIDDATDIDDDGIADVLDQSSTEFGSGRDSDQDGIADAADLDDDNDGIPDSSEGSGDMDGDGIANSLDRDSDNDGITDTLEAGGVDANRDGIVDSFADTNRNGLADSLEAALGGRVLPVADADADGASNFLDLDSDSDGLFDIFEAGGLDADGDGRVDTTLDANRNGLVDSVDGSVAAGVALSVIDTDGDGVANYLDADSDNDGLSDGREGRGDADGDGVADYLDKPGSLETAVHGGGSFEVGVLFALSLLLAARMYRKFRRTIALAALTAVAAVPTVQADEPVSHKGEWSFGIDAGLSRLKPRNANGGYRVDDSSSAGYRFEAGYQFAQNWSLQAFYADLGEAGIASDNPAAGHLGELAYQDYGAGVEWTPLLGGRNATLYPVFKAGVVVTTNSVTSPYIQYDKQHGTGVYLGAGGVWQFASSWRAQIEVTSYDKDEGMLTLGVRKTFGRAE